MFYTANIRALLRVFAGHKDVKSDMFIFTWLTLFHILVIYKFQYHGFNIKRSASSAFQCSPH